MHKTKKYTTNDTTLETKQYVFCFVFDPEGRVLVLRRSNDMRARPGEWDLPGGGVDEGEELKYAVLREIFEETGLAVIKLEQVLQKSGERDGNMHEFTYFRAYTHPMEPMLSHEHDAYEWHEPLIAAAMTDYKPHKTAYEFVTPAV